MDIDPNNPVVRLCAAGISAETAGRLEEAAELYRQAWDARADDFDVCIVAHYLARVQQTPLEVLRWNQESLRHAEAVNDSRVEVFYPSLYMGKAHEDVGEPGRGEEVLGLAERKAATLPEGKYADMVRRGIAQGLERVSA